MRRSGERWPTIPHTRAVLSLDNGSDVAYRDVRRFGTWELLRARRRRPVPRRAARARAARPRSRRPARASGSKDGGRRSSRRSSTSGRSPGSGTSTSTRRSGTAGCTRCGSRAASTATSCARLHRAIRRVLRRGIERQGSTLRDYALPDGAYGSMQDEFRAYGRGGRAVRPLRHAARQDRRRRAHDDVLPALPGLSG